MKSRNTASPRTVSLRSLSLVPLLLLSNLASAGSVITMESRDLTVNPVEISTVTITADGTAMRMDTTGERPSDASTMIFHGDVNEMTAIDHDSRQYYTIDEAAIEGIAGQMNDVMQQMQDALKDLPPEQRAMAEQMMKQRMGAMAAPVQSAPRPELVATGDSETVNGYDCELYNVLEAGRLSRDMCITDWSNVEGAEDFKDNVERMARFFEGMLDMYRENGMDVGPGNDAFAFLDDVNGFPVRLREYGNGSQVTDETTVKSSESRSVDAAFFRPPADYTRQSLQR